MTQPINTMEGPLIQMPEQLFMDSFPVAEPVAQTITKFNFLKIDQKIQPPASESTSEQDFFPVAEPVAQPITLQKVQPVRNENNEAFKKRLFNRISQPYKPASEPASEKASEPISEPASEQAFEPASQQASESDSLPALEAIANESSVTSE